jgi:hypothetical protein
MTHHIKVKTPLKYPWAVLDKIEGSFGVIERSHGRDGVMTVKTNIASYVIAADGGRNPACGHTQPPLPPSSA